MLAHHVDKCTTLRMLQPHHAEELCRLTEANRDHLRRWLPWLDHSREVKDSATFIAGNVRGFADNGTFTCGIWYEGALCGVLGYNRIDWGNKTAFPGYWLARDFEGKGIMTSCCRVLVRHAFAEYRLNRVAIHVATENHRSQAIPDRLGFAKEGVLRQAEWLYDHFVDHTVNGLLRSEAAAELTSEVSS
ncbi:MAG: GNAT family N-acetyltransferase [Candidatus Methylacidiphilales bacterium]|nr:GNAT family protein [Candidatus Methylacidiphilales bacterium]